MSRTLTQDVQSAEGRYLTNDELMPLESYAQTYSNRINTYLLIEKYADQLVAMALQQLAQTDQATVQQHGDLCRRDMGDVLRLSARAFLMDDPDDFRNFVLWMQNMVRAVKKEAQSARAYSTLQIIIQKHLPPECARSINAYLQQVIESLRSLA
ncbi:MAG: hypothetical protein IGS48_16535 [Oscillatoriales cyanobacterium C42_A2020_001]|nr:hypothetical protein [Leptolyngbyaceae cyanobacterium C42_A2020_001]